MDNQEKSTRKLAAIVFTDIVGFTKLSADNEPLALQLLQTQRENLKPIVERYNGTWLKELGDGLLLTFDTSKEAIDCSIEIQHTVKNIANLDLRIGIHQGEIVSQGGDVLGDDVNIASRTEPFAAPGGIVVTDQVNASLMRDPVYQTKLVGKPSLKGVRQNISVYCLVSHGLPETDINLVSAKLDFPEDNLVDHSLKTKEGNYRSENRIKYVIGISIFIIGLLSFFYLRKSSRFEEPTQESIAVLPFVNMSADTENEYFSDGITEEILNYLAKIKNLRVISRTSVFTYKGRNDISISEIGNQLGVVHILEGSVRKAGNKVRITAQLIRSADDAHLWSETYDRELKDIFAVQDEIAQTIVNTLKMDYISHSDQPIEQNNDMSIEAFDAYIQGRQHWNKRNKESLQNAIRYFKQTLSLEPEYELAYADIATSYGLMADYAYMPRDEALPLARINVQKAVNINPNSAEVNTALAYINLLENRDASEIETYFKRAIDINPNYVTANHWYSDFLGNKMRKMERSVEFAETAYRLDPVAPIIVTNLSNSYMRAGMLSKAESLLSRAIEINPDFYRNKDNLALVYCRIGRWEDAENLIKNYIETDPNELGAWWSLANIQVRRGKYQNSVESISKINNLISSSNPVGYEFKAFVNYFAKQYKIAEKYADQALGIDPNVPLGNLIKGCIYARNGDIHNADKSFLRAYDRFKGLWLDYETMAIGYMGVSRAINDDRTGALEVIERLVTAGEAPEKNNFIGMIYLEIGQKDKGWELIEKNMEQYGCYIFLKCDPFMQRFSEDQRYISLLKKYNL